MPEPADPKASTRPAPAPEPDPDAPPESPPPEIPNFKVLAKLGQGGQGSVWLAESRDGLGKRCALKVFPREAKASYARELEAWRKVEEVRRASNTPHLVEGYAAGHTPDGNAYVAMAFCDRGSLADLIVAGGPLPSPLAVRYARHVLAALDLLHAYGLWHRDVKPQNVLLGNDGIARLADYGLSKTLGTSVTGSCTPAFAAPEQLAGEPGADGVRIDIYGVAATLFALLTGKPPVPGRPDVFLLERCKVPRPIHPVLLRALNPDPDVRFGRAADFAQALSIAEPGSSGAGLVADLSRAGPTNERSPSALALARADTRAQPDPDAGRGPFGGPFDGPRSATAVTLPGATSGGRAARGSRALLLLVLGLGALVFVLDALRDPRTGLRGAWIGGDAATTGSGVSNRRDPEPGGARPAPWSGAVPLERVRRLSGAPGALALVGSGTAWLASGDSVLAFPTGPGPAHAAPWRGARIVAATASGLAVLGGPRDAPVPVAGKGSLVALAASPQAGLVALARRGEPVRLVALDPGDRPLGTWPLAGPGDGFVTALAFDDAGERLAVATIGLEGEGHVSVHELSPGGPPRLATVLDREGPVALAWLSARALAVGDALGEVALVDPRDGALARTFPGISGEPVSLARSPSGRTLLVLGDDRRLVAGSAPGDDSVEVEDQDGARLFFPRRPRPRLLGYRVADLLGRGDAASVLDEAAFDPARVR